VKAFQALYAFFQEENPVRNVHERNMLKSLEKTFDLYLSLLAFPIDFKFYIERSLEKEESKFFPDQALITPLKAIRNNLAIGILENDKELAHKLQSAKIRWSDKNEFFKQILIEIKNHEAIQNYCTKEQHSLKEDKVILLTIYEILISDSDTFNSFLEESYINWDDDQVLIMTSLQKVVTGLKEDGNDFFSEFYKEEEENLRFIKNLFNLTIDYDDSFIELIKSKTQNWETDRIAVVDLMLMKLAICEMMHFSQIPVKVTINEYLELAKLYSTPSSHSFINGVLDKIQSALRSEDKIKKSGRGLVE